MNIKSDIKSQFNGCTSVLCVIGDPVSHTFSPQIHNTLAEMLGINAVYVPFHVKSENLKTSLDGAFSLGIKGINVTVPHKKDVIKHVCSIDEAVKKIGAINTLKFTPNGYEGYNTDYLGIINTFKSNEISAENKTCAIIGAGGSANAVCYALYILGASKIIIANRTLSSAKNLANIVDKNYNINAEAMSLEEASELSDVDIIIQTTTVGFSDKVGLSPIFGDKIFHNAQFVLDVIYSPWETAFMQSAKKYCCCVNGFHMLIYQAIASFEIFNDIIVSEKLSKKDIISLVKSLELCYNKVKL